MVIPDISEVEQELECAIVDQRIILQKVRRFQNVEQGTIIAKKSEAYLADIIQYDRLRGTRVMGVKGSGIFVGQIDIQKMRNTLRYYPEQFRKPAYGDGKLTGLRKDYGDCLDIDLEEIFIGEEEVSKFLANFGFTLDDYVAALEYFKTKR